MFTAKGLSFVRLPDGNFQVRVQFVEDATSFEVLQRTFIVPDKPALVAQVLTQLQQLRQAALDAQVTFDIVGKTLGSI